MLRLLKRLHARRVVRRSPRQEVHLVRIYIVEKKLSPEEAMMQFFFTSDPFERVALGESIVLGLSPQD